MFETKPPTLLLVNYSSEESVLLRSCLSRTSQAYEILEADEADQILELLATTPLDCVLLKSLPQQADLLSALGSTPFLVCADADAFVAALETLQFRVAAPPADTSRANLAHDLRNSLNSILGYTRLLRVVKDLPEQAQQLLTIIERNGQRQQELLNNWLGDATANAHLSPAPPAPAPAPLAETVSARGELTGIRLLVIEDEADARELLNTVLTKMGATLTLTASGQEALTYLTASPVASFDLLISDIHLPDEDGYSLIRKIRKLPHCDSAQLPAIALTAFSQVEDRIRCLRAGFQTHISKPLDPFDLVTVIQSLLTTKA